MTIKTISSMPFYTANNYVSLNIRDGRSRNGLNHRTFNAHSDSMYPNNCITSHKGMLDMLYHGLNIGVSRE